MAISRIGTDGIDQTSSQQIGGISVGRGAGAVSTNTVVGNGALASGSQSGGGNNAFGQYALAVNTSGATNNAYGNETLYANTTGAAGAAFGHKALWSNTTGSYNVGVGYNALYSNTTASSNTAVGYQAGYSNTTGQENTVVGQQAFYTNTTGNYNSVLGVAALYANTTGSYNVAIGETALRYNTTGYSNTSLGYVSGYSLTTGYLNTFVGKDAGFYVTTGAKNTILGAYTGNQGGLDIRTASNYIVLSDGDGNPRAISTNNGTWLLAGKTSADGTTPGVMIEPDNGATSGRINIVKSYNGTTTAMAFYYSGAGVGTISYSNTATAYNTSSDYRLKENIAPMTGALATIAQLNPVTYKWKADGSDGQGFIAHELQAVVPDAVTGEKDAVDEDGNPVYQGIDTSFLVATLVAAIKELKAEFDAYKEAHP